MELKELENEIKSAMARNKELVENEKKSIESLVEKMTENYENIFLPEWKRLRSIDFDLAKVAGYFFTTTTDSFYVSSSDSSDDFLVKVLKDRCVDEYYFRTFNDLKLDCHFIIDQDRKEMFYKTFPKFEFLTSAESTLRKVDEMQEVFAERFERYLVDVKVKNEKLAETVEKLTAYLKKSSTVEEKSDGSIEITLNGKTYIGTIKEA